MGQKQYFEDLNASGTAIYYRLRLTDMEGRSSYSNVLVVKLKGSNVTGFKVYPNIVQSSTTINIVSTIRQEASISIVDLCVVEIFVSVDKSKFSADERTSFGLPLFKI